MHLTNSIHQLMVIDSTLTNFRVNGKIHVIADKFILVIHLSIKIIDERFTGFLIDNNIVSNFIPHLISHPGIRSLKNWCQMLLGVIPQLAFQLLSKITGCETTIKLGNPLGLGLC